MPEIAVFGGLICCLAGAYLMYSQHTFRSGSLKAELEVIEVESKRSDGSLVYRPTFEAKSPEGTFFQYAGNTWVAPKPHSEGDVVPGRVVWTTGEMRSEAMMSSASALGRTFILYGAVSLAGGTAFLLYRRTRSR